jgi:hypothetical protein
MNEHEYTITVCSFTHLRCPTHGCSTDLHGYELPECVLPPCVCDLPNVLLHYHNKPYSDTCLCEGCIAQKALPFCHLPDVYE